MNHSPRRIGARLLLAVGLCLALEGAGLAAKKPRCSAVQRRAQAKLESSLAVCAHKDISAAIAACSTAKWEKYARQLQRSKCRLAVGNDAGKQPGDPLLAKIRAEGISADDLALADGEARDAHLALRDVLTRFAAAVAEVRAGDRTQQSLFRFGGEITAAVERLTEAEQLLYDVETALWSGMRGDALLPWLIDEPLRVAMEQVQVEVRRLLGPDFRTEIEALRDERACAGDVVADRLIADYGRAVVSPAKDRTAEVAALGRLAAQLACISFRQASLLDLALGIAYDMVATRLERVGLERVRGPFTRFFAPLEVLVLDTVKHAGDHAHAWYWFKDHRQELGDEVERLGWATGDILWLYDRVDGKLVGFPPCEPDDEVGRCVDLASFLDSIADARAIGFGDCALAGMVAGGLKHAGAAALYACPSADCGAGAAPSKGPGGSGLPSVGGGGLGRGSFGGGGFGSPGKSGMGSASGPLPWSDLSAGDRNMMYELGCGGVGGGGGSGGSGDGESTQGRGGHGSASGEDDCFEQAITGPSDPFEAFVQCTADAAGARGPGEFGGTIDLEGVPVPPGCGPSVAAETGGGGSGGGATSTTTPPASSSTTTVADGNSTSSTTEPPAASPPCVPSGLLDAISKVFDCGLPVLQMALSTETPKVTTKGGPSPASAAGAVIAAEIELLKPENAQNVLDIVGAKVKNTIELECTGDGALSAGECATLAKMKPGDAGEYLKQKGLMDCVSEEECDSACTSLNGQVMQRLEDCQRALTDEMVGDAPSQHDLVSRINPAPDAVTGGLPNDPLTSCLLAQAGEGSGGVNHACGLVLCTDGVSTKHSMSACCGQGAPALGVSVDRLLLERTCDQVQCGGGESVVADGLGTCGCGSAVGGIGGGTPIPQPGPPQR